MVGLEVLNKLHRHAEGLGIVEGNFVPGTVSLVTYVSVEQGYKFFQTGSFGESQL